MLYLPLVQMLPFLNGTVPYLCDLLYRNPTYLGEEVASAGYGTVPYVIYPTYLQKVASAKYVP